MDDETQPDQLQLFENNIRGNLESIRTRKKCKWCQNPNLPIVTKGLCSSCYRWDRIQCKLSEEVSGLPARTIKDIHSNLRRELDVANCAIELCKNDGFKLELHLNETYPFDLVEEFQFLAKKVIGSRKGSTLFQGTTHFFYDLSPTQRIWLWYLLSIIISEKSRKDRLREAQSVNRNNSHAAGGCPASNQ